MASITALLTHDLNWFITKLKMKFVQNCLLSWLIVYSGYVDSWYVDSGDRVVRCLLSYFERGQASPTHSGLTQLTAFQQWASLDTDTDTSPCLYITTALYIVQWVSYPASMLSGFHGPARATLRCRGKIFSYPVSPVNMKKTFFYCQKLEKVFEDETWNSLNGCPKVWLPKCKIAWVLTMQWWRLQGG